MHVESKSNSVINGSYLIILDMGLVGSMILASTIKQEDNDSLARISTLWKTIQFQCIFYVHFKMVHMQTTPHHRQ